MKDGTTNKIKYNYGEGYDMENHTDINLYDVNQIIKKVKIQKGFMMGKF